MNLSVIHGMSGIRVGEWMEKAAAKPVVPVGLRILLCSCNTAEIARIEGILKRRHAVQTLGVWEAHSIDFQSVDAVILDASFTRDKGREFITKLYSSLPRPLLFISAPDDPLSAIEAQRLGVSNFLVKTDKMYEVLELALCEAVRSFKTKQNTDTPIESLRTHVTDLEAQVERLSIDPPSRRTSTRISAPAPHDAAARRRDLLTTIVDRLNRGEVNLPAYPELSRRLDQLIEDGRSVEQIAKLLKQDTAVSAKLISISNSAYYRRSNRENRTVEHAIAVLGLDITLNHVTLIANRALYTVRNPRLQPMLASLWRHGTAVAYLSQWIAAGTGFKSLTEAFAMGLFHDIGKLFLIQAVAQLEHGGAFKVAYPIDLLPQFLETNHGVFGTKLLEIWKLPASYGEVAQFHATPEKAPADPLGPRIVYLADLLAAKAGIGDEDESPVEGQIPAAADSLKIDPSMLDTMVESLMAVLQVSGD
jgi:HD-like signal output (HDOD) protein/DNA-binding response OmpR family regulator